MSGVRWRVNKIRKDERREKKKMPLTRREREVCLCGLLSVFGHEQLEGREWRMVVPI